TEISYPVQRKRKDETPSGVVSSDPRAVHPFEVDAALVGRRVELVFDPFDLTTIEVRFEGRAMGLAVPMRITRHTHPKARPEAAPAPVPTGIDYLSLLVARREAELAGRSIGYAGLAAGEPEGNAYAYAEEEGS
ncbi:MAG: hypothetical protein ACRDYD_08115, partial [Acidimicrobiales bacterium]